MTKIEQAGMAVEESMRERVRASIARRGWSVSRMARAAGLARTTVNPWIRGQRSIGGRQLCQLLAAVERPERAE